MPHPSVVEETLLFTLEDNARNLTRVALDCDDAVQGGRRFRRTATGWTLGVPRPALNRVEYRLVVTAQGGGTSVVCDPGNPERVDTGFGERSVALMPGYGRPAWVRREVEPGSLRELTHTDDELGDLPVGLWTPTGLGDTTPAPLLVAHDGPEYARLGDLTRFAAVQVTDGTLPPFRLALMQPRDRDAWYGANPAYVAAELAAVDLVAATVATDRPLVVMGASLGGLAALLVGMAAADTVGGVFAQSGSFFTPDLDPQESTYPYFEQVTAAVLGLPAASSTNSLVVGMTCGRLEENWANNEAMAARLTDRGHRVRLTGLDDLHNFTAWRDGLDPALTDVLRAVWRYSRMD
ncbi:MAG: esterase [Propionibacteriales bacterium]|nr:esterase [Propionibacteriales bacterium]